MVSFLDVSLDLMVELLNVCGDLVFCVEMRYEHRDANTDQRDQRSDQRRDELAGREMGWSGRSSRACRKPRSPTVTSVGFGRALAAPTINERIATDLLDIVTAMFNPLLAIAARLRARKSRNRDEGFHGSQAGHRSD